MTARSTSAQYLETAQATAAFVRSLGEIKSLAMDTEGASFHRYIDRVYLIQLSAAGADAVIDPLSAGELPDLKRLVESPEVEIVFHDADYDLRLLHQDYGWNVRHVFDTRVAAQLVGIRSFGLAALLESFFGVKLNKTHQRADWSMRPLTSGMLEYAVHDTAHLLALRDRLADDLTQKGRLGWAEEEFQRLERIRWEPDDESTAFLRLKGARDLTRRQLAILRELVPWRNAIARELDRSSFRVVGNDTLLAIATAGPRTIADLEKVKGMPRGILERRGQEMVGLIGTALSMPEDQLPRFPKVARWARDPEFDDCLAALKRVRDAVATSLDLDPGVLCGRERLETIVRARPRTSAALGALPDIRAWQVDVLGDGFLRALASFGDGPGDRATVRSSRSDDSPYRDA